ncbi:transcription termination/antitermination NusG family protein [Phenylobacterium sp. J426]|uniref:transcription termination/antitermination protein NusG n=1 Tax=Phenylobacterium sp. J426 TaxID=2898439 RepID=UPI002151B431|nr:transcription termination/antitermination NusG family protein [Phenylobacterium sp. J426]MCR5874379.1 transcription termination/antitermination NusG family protein [Phenylobacterium sp. J426]
MSQWYAIRTATRREGAAMAALTEKGFTVFTPHETVPRKVNRVLEAVTRPLLPGYVFVLTDPDRFAEVRKIDAVLGFVRYYLGGVLTPVAFPFAAILEMQIAERAGHYDSTRTRKPNAYHPRKGEKVQITAGPYMSFVATVLAAPRGQRAKLLIEGPFPARKKTVDVRHLQAA